MKPNPARKALDELNQSKARREAVIRARIYQLKSLINSGTASAEEKANAREELDGARWNLREALPKKKP